MLYNVINNNPLIKNVLFINKSPLQSLCEVVRCYLDCMD